MALSLLVHEFRTDSRNPNRRVLARTHPYVRIFQLGEPALFLQGGLVHTAAGDVVDPIPEWALAHIARLSPASRRETGFEPEEPVAVESDDLWTCDQCGERVHKKVKGVHIGRHSRLGR
jgi:hypothetical protein